MCTCGAAGPGPGRYGAPTTVGFNKHDPTRLREPAYSIGLKCLSPSKSDNSGLYQFNNVDKHGRYPYQGYSMGLAHKSAKVAAQAGPADYYHQEKPKPGYSMGLLTKSHIESIGPGPKYYWQSKGCPTGWTIQGKEHQKNKFVTPGPYDEINPNVYKNRAPRAPIGIRGRQLGASTPGPGPAYLPVLPTKPGYSFGLHHPCCAPPLITYGDNNSKPC